MRDFKTCFALPIEDMTIAELRQHAKECHIQANEPLKKKAARDMRRRHEAAMVELNRKSLKLAQTLS